MARTVSIGAQDFEALISRNNFYIDKTHFIKEWWENDDIVTLLTRPRRFGKTLNMRGGGKYLRIYPYGRRKSTGNCRGHIRYFFCLLLVLKQIITWMPGRRLFL